MIKKITSMTVHKTANGEQVAFTYSEIDDDGKVLAQNKRAEIVVLDEEAANAIEVLYNFVKTKIPE